MGSRPQVQRATARSASLPAPVGGWNARDALAEMAPTDAVTLVNWFPTPSQVVLRQGFAKWATGFASDVNAVPWLSVDDMRTVTG